MSIDNSSRHSPRSSERKVLPIGISATLIAPGGSRAFVVIHDISVGGICVTRQGKLQLEVGSDLQIEVANHETEKRFALPAVVRWLRIGRFTTMVGLSLDNRGAELESFMGGITHDRKA